MDMTFYVSLSIEETLERLDKRTENSLTGWKAHVYRLETPEGKHVTTTLYRKTYLRTGREYLATVVVLDDITGKTRVHFSSDGAEQSEVDLGAANAFQKWLKKALSDVLLPEQ